MSFAERHPNSLSYLSQYIKITIQTFDYEETQVINSVVGLTNVKIGQLGLNTLEV